MLFDSIRNRSLSDDACFLCGTSLTESNSSKEHVIPKWAQKRFDLWDQELGLLNGTYIPYRNLTIPCCRSCNNGFLEPVERRMEQATQIGAEAVRALGDRDLFVWLGKIFYGLVHKELFLWFNRAEPEEGTIATPDLIESFSMHHMFLQSIRVPFEFTNGYPCSVFVYDTKQPDDPQLGWDFRDHLPTLFISARVGAVGLAAALQDGGAQQLIDSKVNEAIKHSLHPVQHAEVAARVCYFSMLCTRGPKFLLTDGDPVRVLQMPLAGLSDKPLFGKWDQQAYAKVLSEFLMAPLDVVNPSPGKTFTFLHGPDGKFKDISFTDFPVQRSK